ncbi:MAG: type II and III secretion system protein family protein [Hyphomicrobiales bacterium]
MVVAALAVALALIVASAAMALPARADGPAVFRMENPEKIVRIQVPLDKSETVRVDRPFAEALVGNSEVADVIPLTDQSIYVLGKKIGATRLSILDAEKRLLGIVEVEVAYDVTALRAQIQQSAPHSNVRVVALNGKIHLSGGVPDAVTQDRILSIAQQYAPEAVTNSMVVDSAQQVMLEVRFIEASRNAARDLGVNWQAVSRSVGNFAAITNFPGTVGVGAFPSNNIPFGTMVTRVLGGGVTADVLIQALEERGVARRLAEPNLVALSGDTASFLAGGEFPFPVASKDDTITIEFKKFGVGLAFTPTVLAGGLVNLKIEPEVSEIDPNNTITVNGTTIPGLVTRRAKTTVELRDGQSFAIAGLLQANTQRANRQLPWIGQVPVLGTLFRSASFERRETDLVIIVTPRLVQPATPGQELRTPLDHPVAGNDVDQFLNGKLERWAPKVKPAWAKNPVMPEGHMLTIGEGGEPAYKPATYKGLLGRKDGYFGRDVTGSIQSGPSEQDVPAAEPVAAAPRKASFQLYRGEGA